MKQIKFPLMLILFFFQVGIFSQRAVNISHKLPIAKPYSFFASYEDFLANKPIQGYEIFRIERGKAIEMLNYDHLWVRRNGEEVHLKPKDYPSFWISDEHGLLNRYFEGDPYLLWINGKYCYYLISYNDPVRLNEKGEFTIIGESGSGYGSNYQSSSFPSMHWSIGIDGPIKEIKDKDFLVELEKYKLGKKYERKKPKRELIMSAVEYGVKKHKVYVEFIELLNQQ